MLSDSPISMRDLRKLYGRTEALGGISLTIEPGEVFGYLGPNGAGKSTTIRILMGMLQPTSGEASVFGSDTWRNTPEVHRLVGYVPGEPSVYARLSGHQHVDYLCSLRRRDDRRLARELAERLDLDLGKPARALSRGNRQKLALVLALMSEPKLLILDEPTSGLDPLVQRDVHSLLRDHTERGGSVFLSSHVLGEVQRVADRIGVLKQGRIVAVERLEELAAKSLHRVRATFAGQVRDEDFSGVPGLRDVITTSSTLICSAPQSALDALLKKVSAHKVVDFECAEAELDDLFLGFYGGEEHVGHGAREVTV
jgi:ABC-2 type transport system ATP-binding protein